MIPKIILVNPEIHKNTYYGAWGNFIYPFLPASLLNTAAYLQTKNIEVKIFDFRIKDNFKDFSDLIKSYQPDVVCFDSLTFLINDIFFAAKEIKEINTTIKTFVFGYNAFANPDDLITNPYIDFITQDQSGKTIADLILTLKTDTPITAIPNLCYLANNTVTETKKIVPFTDLNYLPTPSMPLDLIEPNKYWQKSNVPWAKRFISLYSSTGCAFSCNFCLNSQTNFGNYRAMSLDKVFADIDYYIEKYNIDSLIFLDPVFALNYKRTEKFCDMMINKEYNRKISFAIQTRADTLDKKLIEKLKEAGCKVISMGIETPNNKFLKDINKKIEKNKIVDIVKTINKSKITVRASFLFGLEEESFFDSLKTIYFALTLPVYSCMFFIKTPYPGTTLWKQTKNALKDKGTIKWEYFSQFAGYTKNPLVWKPKGRHDFELKFLQRFAFVICHLKPTLLFYILKNYTKSTNFLKIFTDIKIILKNFLIGCA